MTFFKNMFRHADWTKQTIKTEQCQQITLLIQLFTLYKSELKMTEEPLKHVFKKFHIFS